MRKPGWIIGAFVAIAIGAFVLRPTMPPATSPVEGFIPAIPEAVRLRHEHHLRRIQAGPIDVAFFGDSLLRGWEDHGDLWARHFEQRRAGLFATTNDTTSNLLWRLDHGEADGYQAKLVVVLIGINNRKYHSAAETAQGIEAVVAILREKQPQAKVLLLGLLPQGRKPTDAGRRFVIDVNRLISEFANGDTIHFRDHGPALLEPDSTLSEATSPDGTHLSKLGYERWAKMLEWDLQ